MSPEEFNTTKQRLVGTWLQEFSTDGRAKGAWEVLPNGDFAFVWHEAPARLKAAVSGMKGRWELLDPATPRLKLTVTSVKSPMKRVIDVAYMGTGLVNPFVFVFRSLMVGVTEVGATKMANATYGFEAKVDIRNNNLVALQRTDGGRNGNPQQVLWHRH
jgi:hypothetical protein